MKRRLVLGTIIVLVAAAGVTLAVGVPALPERSDSVPVAMVTRGPLKPTVHAVGELRAGRTMTLVAPSVGGMLRIVRMVPTGVPVKQGELVMEFDPADQQYALQQAKFDLAEAEQEIVKMKADAAVQAAQDEVALLTARFDVRRAELDASGNEFIGAIDAQKNVLSLEEARRRLAQLEEDVKSRAATNKASLAVVEEKRNKAQLGMQRTLQNIDSLVLESPVDGVVSVKENRDGQTMFFFGMVLPEYRAGDQVWPGRAVVDVVESGRMELRAKVDEGDRGNLTAGQPALVTVDSLPGEKFKAKVGVLSALANRASFFEAATVTRVFDATFQFDQGDPRLKAGSSARVTIQGRELPDALHVPRQAVFDKRGKNYVFVKNGDRFEEREVKVEQRTESRVVISGVADGTTIALVDPTAKAGGSPGASTTPVPPAGPPR